MAATSRRAQRMPLVGRLWRRTAHHLPRVAPPPVLLHRRALRLGTDAAYIETLRARRGLPAALPAGDSPVDIRRAEVLRSCTIDPGESVQVSLDDGGSRYLAEGWSIPESDFTWNDGHYAEIAVRRPDGTTPEPVTLTVNLAGRIHADRPHQRVSFSVDGEAVASQTIGAESVEVRVPLGDLGHRPTIIALDLPDAFADGPDPRVMAVRLLDLRLGRDT